VKCVRDKANVAADATKGTKLESRARLKNGDAYGDDLIAEAKRIGFVADWGRVDLDNPAQTLRQIKDFIVIKQMPFIVCQQWTNPLLGHFRVIVGIDGGDIIMHDASPEIGGANMRWPIARVIDVWRPTGLNVTGGVAIWITPTPLTANMLTS
jgi:hypothetical protein